VGLVLSECALRQSYRFLSDGLTPWSVFIIQCS